MSVADLAASTKALGSRFTVSGLLPFALLGIFLVGLAVVAASDESDPLEALVAAADVYGAAGIAVVLTSAFVVAVATQPFQVGVVRLLEGYWGATNPALSLRTMMIERQRRRRRRAWLARQEADDNSDTYLSAWHTERLARYPADDDLMPTLLGNTLRSSERRAGERYGLDTVKTWSRLYHVLPETIRADVAELHGQVDAGARLSIAFALGSVAAAPVLLPFGWWNLLAPSLAALSWLSYRGAVTSASDLADVLATAFDLHRFDLIRAMHLPLPRDPRVEADWNSHLSDFFMDEVDVADGILKYVHDD